MKDEVSIALFPEFHYVESFTVETSRIVRSDWLLKRGICLPFTSTSLNNNCSNTFCLSRRVLGDSLKN